ncbi:hypothetical protein IVA93_33985 [Bradyrhizobium sp. 155]|uniref:hypothetical protein n=1 Tax=unclassified Bradyrhizobium TaxID=2631580 RepID=UPI0003774A16|nr:MULTISPECIES: hypothetical protein [unclassified Bradyrhizobium]MCK1700641.1 hypothetical protein [Bradyrhizobium sp. 146]UPK11135.1 hypothetical protein IVA93_33985 [Bradyrhizobium sp. 155]
MGFETISGIDIQYGLISFDVEGKEISEPGGLMSQRLIDKARTDKVTNVFLFCHGWKGDVPGAKNQYALWIKAFAESADRAKADTVFPNFRPLFIGLHWPSLPFGDEEVGSASFALGGAVLGADALLQIYLKRLGDSPKIRGPLEIIIEEARRNSKPDELPEHVKKAYLDLNDALGLHSEGVDAPPDADREGFDPEDSFDAGNEAGPTSFGGGGIDLGGLLGPLRQLSYWTMKKRARTIGEGGMHDFLKKLQTATADNHTRIHLMGHSFGTIVVSGMLGGPGAAGPLSRPVDSVALVQGAVSLWCYADSIPFDAAGPGYFSRIMTDGKVRGPIVTTQSKHDSAVGSLYPLASRIRGSVNFANSFPKFGAIGAFGLQGVPDASRRELKMLGASGAYQFETGKVYNLDGSEFIAHLDGVSGAHSDIAGPEVAHLIWAAAFASAAGQG